MSQDNNKVKLYQTETATDYTEKDDINAALTQAAENKWSSCFIECEKYFAGENSEVHNDSVVASILFNYTGDADFGHSDFYLKGEIELESAAVKGVNRFESTANNITLKNSSSITASTNVSAAGKIEVDNGSKITASTNVSAAGKIEVSEDSKIIVGSADTEFTGGIKLDAEKEMTAGTSIAAGKIKVGANATITATAGSITATTGDITLDDEYSKMTAGDSIAAENIIVGVSTAIKATNGSITANSDITLNDTWSGYAGAEMTAGDSIAAGGKITVGKKTTVEATNGSITANSNIALNDADQSGYFATMTALESIAAGGDITLGNCAIVKATNGSITANGDITLHDSYFGDLTKMTAGDAIAARGAITLGKDAEMTASSIKAASIDNSAEGAKININAEGFSGTKKVIDVDSNGGGTLTLNHVSVTTGLNLIQLADGDVFITDQTILYVNTAWAGQSGDVTFGSVTAEIGVDAFAAVAGAVGTATAANPIMVIGGQFTASNAPTFNGIETFIQDGTFNTSVCGGEFVENSGYTAVTIGLIGSKKNISLTISGGEFNKIVFAGDRLNSSCGVVRYGNVNLTIEGGTFNHFVAGAEAYTYDGDNGNFAELHGDVTLTIKGGTFQSDKWVYGGCLASNKGAASSTAIYGTVTVSLDSTDRDVTVSHIVAGSYGTGNIYGSTKLEVTGSNKVTASELWGGCSSDYYTIGGSAVTYVKASAEEEAPDGDRLLSFTGFRGVLECAKIRDFTSAEFKNDSRVTLSKGTAEALIDMSYVSYWTFDLDSKLIGADFKNDFTDDTFAYGKSSDVVTASWGGATVFENVDELALTGFAKNENSGFSSVTLFGKTATWSEVANAYVTNIEGGSFNYKLYSTGTGMAVGIA